VTFSPSPRIRWFVVLLALVVPFLMSLIYFVLLPGTWLGNGLYVVMKIMLVVWPAVATLLILRERLDLGLSNGWRLAMVGFGWGLGIVTLMLGLMVTPLGDIIRAGADNIQTKVEGMGVLDHFVWFALFLSVIHSLIEEVYWRRFVAGNLLHLVSPWKAHLLAGIGFSAHHIVVVSQFFPLGMAFFLGSCVGIGGVLWSVLMVKQRSLLGAWMSHMVVDIGIMIIGARLMGLL
jgi:membrane protease YdiL (CAAX protease family)